MNNKLAKFVTGIVLTGAAAYGIAGCGTTTTTRYTPPAATTPSYTPPAATTAPAPPQLTLSCQLGYTLGSSTWLPENAVRWWAVLYDETGAPANTVFQGTVAQAVTYNSLSSYSVNISGPFSSQSEALSYARNNGNGSYSAGPIAGESGESVQPTLEITATNNSDQSISAQYANASLYNSQGDELDSQAIGALNVDTVAPNTWVKGYSDGMVAFASNAVNPSTSLWVPGTTCEPTGTQP